MSKSRVLLSILCVGGLLWVPGCPETTNGPPPRVIEEYPEDPEFDGTEATSPPTRVQIGSDGLLLRGTVLTADTAIESGEVVIEDGVVTCVDTSCETPTATTSYTVIETEGVISPGLVDAHNHIAYNFLPPWLPPTDFTFGSRYEWADRPSYEEHIAPYADNRNSGTHFCPAAKWGELRSLIHGTTTVQGQSFQQRCIDWAVRNADHYHGLQHNHLRTTIASPVDISADQAQNYVDSFEAEQNPTTRLAVHMAEGIEGERVENEFDAFAGRGNYTKHPDISLLEHGTAMLIHGVPLTPSQIEEVYLTDSQFVWSPSSNFHLYGQDATAPIEQILQADITTALGPDWTISGAFDMLHEMRIAYDWGHAREIEQLTPRRIWEMATTGGAEAVGLHESIGRIEPGYRADIAVFGRRGDDPYQAVLESRAEDIEMVFVDGELYFGDSHLEEIARNDHCESIDACGTSKFLCVQNGPDAEDRKNEELSDIRRQLVAILEGRDGAPEEEQYGRGDELLDLVICTD